jgi:hypothetical protein
VNGDNDILFFDPNIKKGYGLTNIQPDRSYIQDINAFPSNIEIHTVKTYIKANIGPLPVAPTPATFELNSSLVLLPKVPMQPRYFDERVGYFATSFTDFDANPQGVKETAMITRWKLEPKDKEAYLRGDLVEPIKPILFYIDPATPKKWMPYLILGVNDWNIAFEQAGFKNAIIAKEAPVNDSSWNIDEIIETHINWYHNVMDVLHKWFFIQTAAVDQNAQKPQFSDSLMGRLIRFVVSHEVGHTLGLRHNFGSSSTVPVDSMRSKSYLENNGYTPSIMDYSRFNYVAQPEDNIPERDLIPRIGAYDKWAIEWGYRWFPNKETREQETERLNKWVIDKSSHNKQFWFGTEADPNDPRSQNEDLGDDAMKAGEYGIKNLKRIYPHLIEWTKEPAEDYEPLKKMYSELVIQFGRYMGHAAKNIGGIMTTPRTVEEKGTVIEFVPKLKQQEAMQFLQAQLFKTPNWLIDKKMDDLMGDNPLNTIGNLQNNILGRLISGNTIDKLIRFEASDPRNAYTASMMLQDLRNGIWSELSTHQLIDINRRNLQKQYVELLVAMINPQAVPPPARSTNDQLSIVKQHAKGLLTSIKDDLPFVRDPETKWHLQDCVERLTEALNLKK